VIKKEESHPKKIFLRSRISLHEETERIIRGGKTTSQQSIPFANVKVLINDKVTHEKNLAERFNLEWEISTQRAIQRTTKNIIT
jgi:hypothetical protein